MSRALKLSDRSLGIIMLGIMKASERLAASATPATRPHVLEIMTIVTRKGKDV